MLIDELLGPILKPKRPLSMGDSINSLPSWDSARHVDVILALEEAIGTDLTAAEIEKLRSVRDIVEVCNKHGLELTLKDQH